jgi:hypothetical protein
MRTLSARICIPFLCEPDPQESAFLSYANLIRRICIPLPYVYLICNNPHSFFYAGLIRNNPHSFAFCGSDHQQSAFLSYAGLFYNNPHPFALPYAVLILNNPHSFLLRA